MDIGMEILQEDENIWPLEDITEFQEVVQMNKHRCSGGVGDLEAQFGTSAEQGQSGEFGDAEFEGVAQFGPSADAVLDLEVQRYKTFGVKLLLRRITGTIERSLKS